MSSRLETSALLLRTSIALLCHEIVRWDIYWPDVSSPSKESKTFLQRGRCRQIGQLSKKGASPGVLSGDQKTGNRNSTDQRLEPLRSHTVSVNLFYNNCRLPEMKRMKREKKENDAGIGDAHTCASPKALISSIHSQR